MLGVLKRRWKPKRGVAAANNNNNNNNNARRPSKTEPIVPSDVVVNRTATSPRAIHPVADEKAALVVAYGGSEFNSDTLPGGGSTYPLAPNICVEAGRIEFIKPPTETATSPEQPSEKEDSAKEWLERRVAELEEALEVERKNLQKERLISSKLQRQLNRRELAQRDVDRERRLRVDSETRLRSSLSEAERCKTRLSALQKEFSRMEETVRSMLQYKSRYEFLKHEKNTLSLAYENRIQQFQAAVSKLSQENDTLKKQLRALEAAGGGEVVERLRELERDNSVLTQEGEVQRRQYEQCLDDIANQVVRALLAQKGLREEIGGLQKRIKELETQNRALSSLLLQQLHCAPCTSLQDSTKSTKATVTFALPTRSRTAPVGPTTGVRPSSCDEARLRVWEWLPVQRPRSLNLDTCCQYQYRHRARPLLTALTAGNSKKSGEDEGSESPESGNRDEGYSTMSSDVQGPLEAPRRGLEDLKEASDETDSTAVPPIDCTNSPDRLLEVPDTSEVVLIPLSVAVAGTARHSFPPVQDLLPFQHIMRSFSDSHLCLKLTPNSPSPSYSLTSTESLFLMADKQPLRRSRATTSLLCTAVQEEEDDSGSWSSADYWDTDYVQHWLRLDETRSQLQQQIEYDAAELEDWTMEEILTPNQPPLPSIQETNAPELEEDSNECLWNSSSYLVDMAIDGTNDNGRCLWPYNNSSRCLISPGGDSWSSAGTNSEDSKSCNDCQNSSKRSSTAMSTDSGESPVIGTDFTRDFYRLVKFESTKSLASTSSRSQAGDNTALRRSDLPQVMTNDREQALQSVLNFIAEQQQYCRSREVADCRPNDKHHNIYLEETSPDMKHDRPSDHDVSSNIKEITNCEIVDNSETPKNISTVTCESNSSAPNNKIIKNNTETVMNDQNITVSQQNGCPSDITDVRLSETVTPVVNKGCADENVISDSVKINDVEIIKTDSSLITDTSKSDNKIQQVLPNNSCNSPVIEDNHLLNGCRDKQKVELINQSDFIDQSCSVIMPRLLLQRSSTGILHPVPEEDEDHCQNLSSETLLVSDIASNDTTATEESKSDIKSTVTSDNCSEQTTVIMSSDSKMISFHEHASSKDVIDELNRMIRKGDDNNEIDTAANTTNLDMACCCPTGWVHVERDIDFTDPKARANLLDVMLAASHSSSSAGSETSGSESDTESEGGDDPSDYQHLHRLHRFRRQKKASATREPLGALRCPATAPRPCIIGRDDFFVRYGEKEKEAVASFDFLEELSTTSVSGASSCDNPTLPHPPRDSSSPLSHSPTPDLPEHLSISDSCAGSFSGSEPSLEAQ
ncbi:uncharacterized protein LOC142323961 [Lycorma delicatula]|uniref:uncharacterized protein LOC142323961 n=1 Tax=Lycorma delicatula TaxID=130591 RepID=UPI003F51A4C4